MRWFYSRLMWLAQPLLRRKLRRRSLQEPGYGQAMDERFGYYSKDVPPHTGPTIWIHAVSLGETRAAAVLVAALRAREPQLRLLLTHGTATGRAEGVKLLLPGDLQAWQPWDTAGAVARFLTHFKPDLGVLMETEVWPNLVAGCQEAGVKLVLVNARLSDKSLRQSQRMAWLARPAFAALTAVWAQTPQDAQRLTQLGAPVRGALGNLKFDASPDATQLERGRLWRAQLAKPVVMFASSREGEELALLDALKIFRPLAQIEPAQADINSIAMQVHWLIVPRHPQRFEVVAKLIEAQGFAVQRRSAWPESGPLISAPSAVSGGSGFVSLPIIKPTIWLGDSLGEMALYYGLADVALLGGSFAPLGGQNLIEAAACACPVVMGPHTFNFAEAAEQAMAAGAAQRVTGMAQAVEFAHALAVNPTRLQIAKSASSDFAQAHRGAAQQLAKALVQLLAATGTART
jgi:3-deoxy-D-manno-octulosonic-acid transferase